MGGTVETGCRCARHAPAPDCPQHGLVCGKRADGIAPPVRCELRGEHFAHYGAGVWFVHTLDDELGE